MSGLGAHVQIRRPEGWPERTRANPDHWEVLVDGVSLARKIVAESLVVEFPVSDLGSEARVTMTLACDVLDLDLPDAMVDVMREQGAVLEFKAEP